MKNLRATALIIMGISTLAFASLSNGIMSPNAIGVRLGGDLDGGGAEVSYQKEMTLVNRLELDVGWYRGRTGDPYRDWNQLGLVGIYQWDWNITKELNWYVGPGAAVSVYSGSYSHDNAGVGLDVGGQIGIEYNFNELGAPLLVSLDVRPLWGFLNNGGGGGDGALSIRYTF